ncbi:hypothetical protein HY624_03040, partial [Candidatus Uhrbacteria bacterium]|nr:hypothetical protein [Candidatus Uhrbacteria bacterium]
MSPTLEKPLHNPGESPATPKSSEPIPVEDLDLVVDFGTEDNNDDLEEIGGGIEDDWGDLEDDVHETETMLTEAATEVASEEAKKEIEELAQKVKKMSAAVLEKVSEQLGSNRGGWYEHKETKERYYIKFYTNPDQARAEFITNAIYEKLGMGAVRSELFEMDGQLAIASKEISGAKGSNREELKTAADVRNGFIADAYLGNWDVVGLVFDNIVKGEDGRFYRIDNGGSLTFRAQGSAKDFSPNDIPELKNMQRHEFPAGQIFDGLTDEDMRRQAARLLDSISDADIDAIIATSGMTGDTAETIRAGLKGRRTVLRERFGVKQLSKERIPVAMEKLREQAERVRNVELRPRVGILADSDKIENQQVDVIDVSDEGRLELNFKLTGTHYERIRVKLQRMYEQQEIPSGSIRYGKAGAQRYSIADSWDVSRDGVTLHFAQGRGRYGEGKRSAHGLVTIEVQRQGVSQEEIARRIDAIVVDILEIPDGLTPPETSAETAYKWARYAWHHKLDAGTPPSPEILQRLRREEVVPGYFTIVDPEKHAEYEAISPYAVYHQVQHVDIIPKIVQAGGLLSTHERYRRGLILSGMSSGEDLGTGGADSVFTRTITEAAHVMDSTEIPQASFVFEPSLMDRTDWYA